ncbi:hypothetical protein IAU60_004487 [Kwoniella sp. DSM 27419]
MEFYPVSSAPHPTAKNLYPCLAHITISPNSSDTKGRRLSTGSYTSDNEGGGNALSRVISGGGRRKSSFGPGTGQEGMSGGARRMSFGASRDGEEAKGVEGKWYWRVQAGVTDSQLVLLPLSQPPNPVLTTAPAPLSHAMPSHSSQAAAGTRTEGAGPEDEGLVAKMKNLFRRSSTTKDDAVEGAPAAGSTTSGTDGIQERVIDQTEQGEMIPSAHGNAIGATNLNSSAELGWPGVVHGEKLGAIVIPLHAVDKSKITVKGGKKGEGSYVTVPINSHFSQLVHPMLESVGQQNKSDSFPKSGTIKFEFDKDWIGAKAEAELLHHHLTSAITTLPADTHKERAAPQLQEFQLGTGTTHQGHGGGHGIGHDATQTSGTYNTAGAPALAPVAGGNGHAYGSNDIAPDDSVTSSSGKVAGSERGEFN